MLSFIRAVILLVALTVKLGGGIARVQAAETSPTPVRVYSHLLVPAEHPDYTRRAVKPPGWEVFDNQTQFTALRGFQVDDGKITDLQKALGLYTVTNDLGRVVWPSYPI